MSQRDWRNVATVLSVAAAAARIIASAKTGHPMTCFCQRCLLTMFQLAG